MPYFERRRKVLESEGKRWRFVSRYENGKASVELCEVGREHPFYTSKAPITLSY